MRQKIHSFVHRGILMLPAVTRIFHNGATLWRKYAAIKKDVNNNITSIYVKHLGPDGQPPSGQTKADIFKKLKLIKE